MAYSNYTHVGAYAIIKAPRPTVEYTVRGCPTHGEANQRGDFCYRCGQALADLPRTESRQPRLDDLLKDDREPLFSPMDVDGLADDEFIVMGNRGRRGDMPDGDIVEITSADIERCKTEFAHAYSAELFHLEKVATSVTIKFGVVNYVL